MENLCSKYKRELYDSDENAQVRLIFPKESKADFVYDTEKNQSHSKLFNVNENNCSEGISSETKNKFTPQEPCAEIQGARRKALEKSLIRQASREVLHEELREINAPSDLTTEYRSNFYSTNFVPADFFSRKQTESSLKYPVYGTGSNAITIYSHGFSNKNNLLNPFRRYAAFTKSPFERFDVDTS